jgi:hypothetical protein
VARVAKVKISKEFLEMLLRADFEVQLNRRLETNAPKDLKILGLANIPHFGYPHTFYIYVESESFEEIQEGTDPPEINPFVYSSFEVNNG